MAKDFIDDLLNAIHRVLTPNAARLKEVLIVSGMPESTENLRYLDFNRQEIVDGSRRLVFSAVAVINNRRASKWRLMGYQRTLSRIVFSTRWTRNPLDLFLNAIRCDDALTAVLESAPGRYTLLGIVDVEETLGSGLFQRRSWRVRPVIAVPGLDPTAEALVAAFEDENEIRKTKLPFVPVYRKVTKK